MCGVDVKSAAMDLFDALWEERTLIEEELQPLLEILDGTRVTSHIEPKDTTKFRAIILLDQLNGINKTLKRAIKNI